MIPTYPAWSPVKHRKVRVPKGHQIGSDHERAYDMEWKTAYDGTYYKLIVMGYYLVNGSVLEGVCWIVALTRLHPYTGYHGIWSADRPISDPDEAERLGEDVRTNLVSYLVELML